MTIYDDIVAFIDSPEPARFESLALEVFRHQFISVAPYREFCLSQGARPDTVGSVDQIPAIGTAAFKYVELSAAVTASDDGRVFVTSGTTAGIDEPGRHHVPRLDVYRASALRHAGRTMFPDRARMRMLSLHPTAERMPESSLGQMISWIIEEFGDGRALCAADRRKVELAPALEFLSDAERDDARVCLMGTTASFGALFEGLRTGRMRCALPPGSRVMDTGGVKGQVMPLSAEEFVDCARRSLGVDPALVINEYGMTELCSQMYDATIFNSNRDDAPHERRKVGPPWLDVAAVDPAGLKRVPDGEPGLLRFFDLANVGSVSAILTGDLGIVQDGMVRVLGRAADREDHGCALGIEQFASRTADRA
jgi:Acyl-protein synthetase, LuxE